MVDRELCCAEDEREIGKAEGSELVNDTLLVGSVTTSEADVNNNGEVVDVVLDMGAIEL